MTEAERPRARYTFYEGGAVVIIEEAQPVTTISVTNDAEQVIQDLVDTGIPVDRRRIIYRDSEGHWDGLATKDGRFSGFVMLGGVSDKKLAIETAIAREPWIGRK